MDSVAIECKRVLRDDGIVMVNFAQLAKNPQGHHLTAIAFGNRLRVGPEIAWIKACPELGGQFTPLRSTWWVNRKVEWVFIFGKKDSILDRFSVGVPYKWGGNTKRWKHNRIVQCRGDVWPIPYETVGHQFGGKTKVRDHNYQWPLELPKRLIKLAGAQSGDLVLDPFAGSGATGKACQLVDQEIKFIGFDKEEKYCRAL